MTARWVAVLLLVLVAGFAWFDDRPPTPVPADAPAAGFSAGRAMRTVEDLARMPHPAGSPEAIRVRDDLVERLGAAGLATRLHSSTGVGAFDNVMVAGPVDNIVATLPGTDPTGSVVLAAHYDSVPTGPGAADDMSSVAAILETVRALRTGPPLRNDLVVLFTDAEENGLLGADAWVRDELGPRPTVVVNFEARGVSGPSMMFQTSPGNAGLVRAFADAVPHPVGDSSLVEAYRFLPNDTDLSRVLDAGRPGLNFAFIEQPIQYHSTGDSPENLSPASLQGHGDAALGLARVLGGQDLAPLDPTASGAPRQDDATYFRFAGTLVVYPNALVWPIAVLGVLAVAVAVVAGRRNGLLTVPRVLGAAIGALLAAAAGLVLTIGLWQAVVLLRPSYVDTGPFLHRPLAFQCAAVAIAVAVTALWYLILRRRGGRYAPAAGGALVFAVLGVVTAGTVPGVSFLFALPALGAGIGLSLAQLLRERPLLATAAATVGAIPVAALTGAMSWALFGMSGIADGVPVAIGVLVLSTASAVLVSGTRPVRHGLRVPVVALVATVVLAGAGLVLDRPTAERPQPSQLSFLQDGPGDARWVSSDTAPAAWTAGHLDSEPSVVPSWPGSTAVRTGPAAPLPVPGPSATVVERTPERLVLQVTSPRGAPTIVLRTDRPLHGVDVAPAGRPAVRAGDGVDEIHLSAVPPGGARVTLTRPDPGPVTVRVADVSTGLDAVPGFRPRPPELRGAANRNSDQVVLTTGVSG